METLYSHIKHKDRILVNKRVAKVVRAHSKVEIITQDGTVYTGDVLAGGDGIHSVVRKEMWRLGAELKPGYFPEDEWSCKFINHIRLFIMPGKKILTESSRTVFSEGHLRY